MRIRAISSSQNSPWMHLRQELWPESDPAQNSVEVEANLKSGGIIFVAEDDEGVPIGFAEIGVRREYVPEAHFNHPVPYLEGWYVATEHRHRGVGRALVDETRRWAQQNGYRQLASDATLDNNVSIAAHLAIGFSEAGRSVHFIQDLTESPD